MFEDRGHVRRIELLDRDVSYLETEDLRLDELQRTTVDLDEALASLQTRNVSTSVSLAPRATSISHRIITIFQSKRAPRTLHWATAVAVFFLPKHCTRWGVDDMMGSLVDLTEGGIVGRVSRVVVVSRLRFPLFFRNPLRLAREDSRFSREGFVPSAGAFPDWVGVTVPTLWFAAARGRGGREK